MNNDLFPEMIKKPGERVKAWCCDKELDCEIKVFSNGTRHAWGTCTICGKTNAKKQNLPPNLEELKHRLMWIASMIKAMPQGIDKEEAVAMLERFADEMGNEI